MDSNGSSANGEMFARMRTSSGDIVLQLFPNHAPKTVRNFVELAEGTREWLDPESGQKTQRRFFDGLTFHRVIPNFMIQSGCPLGTGTGGPGYRFEDEIHPELQYNRPFLLGMANAGPGTNGSQFFVTVKEQPHLTGKHTIFGEVAGTDSQEVALGISKAATGPMDRPIEPIMLQAVEIERQ